MFSCNKINKLNKTKLQKKNSNLIEINNLWCIYKNSFKEFFLHEKNDDKLDKVIYITDYYNYKKNEFFL